MLGKIMLDSKGRNPRSCRAIEVLNPAFARGPRLGGLICVVLNFVVVKLALETAPVEMFLKELMSLLLSN